MSYLSLLLATDGDPDVEPLLTSLAAQRHRQWELLVASSSPAAPVLAAAAADPRIRVLVSPDGEPVTSRLQSALDTAHGDIVVLLTADLVLHEDALAALAVTFHDVSEADVVYTDEEWLNLHDRVSPFHKPDWSAVDLSGCDYLGRLTAYRTSLVRAVGGIRPGTDGAHAWDLALRATRHARRVEHVRRVLCTAARAPWDADPQALVTAREVAADHLRQDDAATELEPVEGDLAWFRARRPFDRWPRISVVVPTAGGSSTDGGRLVDRCLDGLLDRTDHGPLDVCLVVSGAVAPGVEDSLRASFGERVRVLRLSGEFNYSRAINAGVRATRGDLLLLLNDDIEIIDPLWLRRMVERALRPGVGVVGAKLLFADDRIQHAGVVSTDDGIPGHVALNLPDGDGYAGDLVLDMEYLAVTGACQVLRRDVFDEVGGYDPALPLNFNDVDFCLKVRGSGRSVVQLNAARLRHQGSATRHRGIDFAEQDLFVERWRDAVVPDPFARTRPI